MDVIGLIVIPFALLLLHERGHRIGAWFINLAADAFPERVRDAYREEWLADLAHIDGNAWKIVHGFGIAFRCFGALVRTARFGPHANDQVFDYQPKELSDADWLVKFGARRLYDFEIAELKGSFAGRSEFRAVAVVQADHGDADFAPRCQANDK